MLSPLHQGWFGLQFEEQSREQSKVSSELQEVKLYRLRTEIIARLKLLRN